MVLRREVERPGARVDGARTTPRVSGGAAAAGLARNPVAVALDDDKKRMRGVGADRYRTRQMLMYRDKSIERISYGLWRTQWDDKACSYKAALRESNEADEEVGGSSTVRCGLRFSTLAGQVGCPVLHEPTPALEQVRAPVGRLDPFLDHMCQAQQVLHR